MGRAFVLRCFARKVRARGDFQSGPTPEETLARRVYGSEPNNEGVAPHGATHPPRGGFCERIHGVRSGKVRIRQGLST